MTGDVVYDGRTDYPERMRQIQFAFIDDPREAALDADRLVSGLLQSFVDEMAQRRKGLEAEPGDGEAPATEHLRQAVRRYRDVIDAMAQATYGPGRTEQAEAIRLPTQTSYDAGVAGNEQAETDLPGIDPAGSDEARAIDLQEQEVKPEQFDRPDRSEPLDRTEQTEFPDGTGAPERSEQQPERL